MHVAPASQHGSTGTVLGRADLFVIGTNYTTGFDIVPAEVRAGRVLAVGVRDIAVAHRELTAGDGDGRVGLIGFVRAGSAAWDAVELLGVTGGGRARRMEWWDAAGVRADAQSGLDAIWSGRASIGDTRWRPRA